MFKCFAPGGPQPSKKQLLRDLQEQRNAIESENIRLRQAVEKASLTIEGLRAEKQAADKQREALEASCANKDQALVQCLARTSQLADSMQQSVLEHHQQRKQQQASAVTVNVECHEDGLHVQVDSAAGCTTGPSKGPAVDERDVALQELQQPQHVGWVSGSDPSCACSSMGLHSPPCWNAPVPIGGGKGGGACYNLHTNTHARRPVESRIEQALATLEARHTSFVRAFEGLGSDFKARGAQLAGLREQLAALQAQKEQAEAKAKAQVGLTCCFCPEECCTYCVCSYARTHLLAVMWV